MYIRQEGSIVVSVGIEIGMSSMQKEFEELKQQYGVTVKVVKAQGEYINDLETKNLALAKHIKESKYDDSMTNISTEDYSRRVADLKRGAEYYKQAHETTQKENASPDPSRQAQVSA